MWIWTLFCQSYKVFEMDFRNHGILVHFNGVCHSGMFAEVQNFSEFSDHTAGTQRWKNFDSTLIQHGIDVVSTLCACWHLCIHLSVSKMTDELVYVGSIYYYVSYLKQRYRSQGSLSRRHRFYLLHYENTPIQIYSKFHHQKLKVFR